LAKSGPEQNKAFETLFPEEAGKIRQQTADLYLDPTQLRECLKAGIEIGAHTASHPYLPLISLEERDWEIKESKIELESLIGKETPFFSYPAGKWDKEVREQVIRSGYRGALATGKRAVSLRDQDLFTVPRISPEGVMTMGKFYALLWGIKREWFE
jgi:peptidoglycan/xylan/chitin deacetylase (PgdA/CDA1 family)